MPGLTNVSTTINGVSYRTETTKQGNKTIERLYDPQTGEVVREKTLTDAGRGNAVIETRVPSPPSHTTENARGEDLGISISPAVAQQASSQMSIAPSIVQNNMAKNLFLSQNKPLQGYNYQEQFSAKPQTFFDETLPYTNQQYFKPSNELPAVQPASYYFGKQSNEQNATQFAESLHIQGIMNPNQQGFYEAGAFAIGAGLGAINLVKNPIETIVVNPIKAALNPSEAGLAIGESLKTNPSFFLGEQLGTAAAIKGIGMPLSKGVNVVGDLSVNKYIPRVVEFQKTLTKNIDYAEPQVLLREGQNPLAFSGVSRTNIGGLFQIGEKYFTVKGMEVGKSLNVAEGMQYYKGESLLDVQRYSYNIARHNVGRPSEVNIKTNALSFFDKDLISTTAFSKINKENVLDILNAKVVDQGIKGLGIRYSPQKNDLTNLKASNLYAFKNDLIMREGSASVYRGELFNIESRPAENFLKGSDTYIKNIAKDNFDNFGTTKQVITQKSFTPSNQLSYAQEAVRQVYMRGEMQRVAAVSKSVSKSMNLGFIGGVIPKQESIMTPKTIQFSNQLNIQVPKLSPMSLSGQTPQFMFANIQSNLQNPKMDLFQIQSPKLSQRQALEQLQIPKMDLFNPEPLFAMPSIPAIPSMPKIPSFGENIPFGESPGRKSRYRPGLSGYAPSVEGVMFNLKAKRYSMGLANTGLTARPLVLKGGLWP